jgi:Rieske 2Fe-2S family protein
MEARIDLHRPTATAGLAALREALADVREGHALPQAFYRDPAIFAQDMRHFVTAHWHCIGHASELRAPGDWMTTELAGESIIVARAADGQLHAMLNVCRHRGSRICTEPAGHAPGGLLVCPYHAWTYDCTGALQRARLTTGDFPVADYPLKRVPLRVAEGLLFVTFAERPLGFAHVEEAFAKSLRVYGWTRAKVAARRTYAIAGNWKLVEENYQECYHCGPAHREYARRHVFARPGPQREAADEEMRLRDRALDLALDDFDAFAGDAEPGQESADCSRSALIDGYVTGSRDGRPVAPLMGDFRGRGYDGGYSFADVGPTSNFVAYPDYGLVYRTIPQTVDRTDFELIWLVDQDAVEGRDYRPEDLQWMWDMTSLEDRKIIELNQAGVNSAWFEPGPYTPMEDDARRYVDWYLAAMRAAAGA